MLNSHSTITAEENYEQMYLVYNRTACSFTIVHFVVLLSFHMLSYFIIFAFSFYNKNMRIPHDSYGWFRTRRENVLPLSSITYEGETFLDLQNPEQYLTDLYGYIGENAVFDPETKKYAPKDKTT